jgi:putative immunity protein/bacteriocin
LSAILLCSLLVSPIVSAQSNESNKCNCSVGTSTSETEVRDQLKAEGVEIVNTLTDSEKAIINNKINDGLLSKGTELKEANFEDYKLIDGSTMYKGFKHVTLNGYTYEYIAVKYSVYINKAGDKLITQASWIDLATKELLELTLAKIDDKQNVTPILIYLNYHEGMNSGINSYGFSVWGKNFACSLLGVFTCISYCGIWGLVNPIAGTTCDVLCGVAFAAACS